MDTRGTETVGCDSFPPTPVTNNAHTANTELHIPCTQSKQKKKKLNQTFSTPSCCKSADTHEQIKAKNPSVTTHYPHCAQSFSFAVWQSPKQCPDIALCANGFLQSLYPLTSRSLPAWQETTPGSTLGYTFHSPARRQLNLQTQQLFSSFLYPKHLSSPTDTDKRQNAMLVHSSPSSSCTSPKEALCQAELLWQRFPGRLFLAVPVC